VFQPHRSRTWRDRSRWDTFRPPRASVLGVARTLTSLTRLMDVLQLARQEDGIDVRFTINPGSVFAAGLEEYLADLGAPVLSWKEATRRRFDLAVACAVHRSMSRLKARHLLVMPHGAGYNRLVAESTGDAVSPAGLSRRELMRRGRVLPSYIGVSHEEQISRLAESCPEAVPRAILVGDYCFDRIEASRPRRDLYRARLGVHGARRLVVVNSTWSEQSLLGRCPDLPLRLITALPVDEFAVAVVLHPNVWSRHSRYGVFERLAAAMDAGLLVVPPHEGWRAALIAGDWVVGDHGSTTFYGAALDRVTLLAATGLDELDPAAPAAEFARRAPRLDPDGDLLAQLRSAADRHPPGALADVVDRQLAARGEGGRIVQRTIYSALDVEPPGEPAGPAPVPEPRPVTRPGPSAYDVTGEVSADGSVRVRRWPVVPGHHERARGFYVVTAQETHSRLSQSAEVAARTVVDAELPPARWLADRIRDYPGLNVAVAALAADRALLRLRGSDTMLEAHAPRAWGDPERRLDPALLGAAVTVWLAAGRTVGELTDGLVIRTGSGSVAVSFTPPPAGSPRP
jgi:hypothetical protein